MRIYSIKTYPAPIAKRLIDNFNAIQDDSDFEDDDVVVEKYKGKKFST
jgi:hypothetical protein